MKALILKRYGRFDQIVLTDIPRPTIKPDELLVQVHAAGLNPIDYMIAKGTFKPILKFQLPVTMGSDLAGVVVEVGSRVARFKPGDSIFASVFEQGTGALAEFAVVPEKAAAIKPHASSPARRYSSPPVPVALARLRSSSQNTSEQRSGRPPVRATSRWFKVSEPMR